MKAKICGITHLTDALLAVNHGAWAIGFNFYKHSPRCISMNRAREIASQLPKHITTVGIMIDYSRDEMLEVLEFIDLVQICQPDNSLFLDKMRVIMALQATRTDVLPESLNLHEYGFVLLDAPRQNDGLLGGTGRFADWDFARDLAIEHKLILAGGLNSSNVVSAIKHVKPFAVDVASGVEEQPGSKSPRAVKEFLLKCKNTK